MPPLGASTKGSERSTASRMTKQTKTIQRKRDSAKSRSKPRPSRSQNVGGVRRIPPPQLVAKVCGLTDPFCSHAVGAKYPDDSSLFSLPFTDHHTLTLASSAGQGAFVIMPNYVSVPYVLPTGVVGGIATWANRVANPNANAAVTAYRVVSYGVRCRNIVPPLSSGGMVRLRSVTNSIMSATTNVGSYARSEVLDVALQDAHNLSMVGSRTAEVPTKWFPSDLLNVIAPVTTWISPGVNPITIYLDGCADGSTLDIEIIVHYELMFTESSGMTLFSTPSVPANPLLAEAATAAKAGTKSFFTDAATAVGKQLKDAAIRGLVAVVSARLGGPTAAFAAIRNVD